MLKFYGSSLQQQNYNYKTKMNTTKTIQETFSTTSESKTIVKIQDSDVSILMEQHGLNEDIKSTILKENLCPTTLLSRLHNSFPQHSILKPRTEAIFSNAKNKYTGLPGFRMICDILKSHGIVLSDLKERELFVEVYAFLATKHILNTIDWSNYQTDPVFQLIFPQPNMIEKNIHQYNCCIGDCTIVVQRVC